MLRDSEIYDNCEFCGITFEGVFCSCSISKKEFYHEETKREILNDLYQSLNTRNIQLTVGEEKWA
jgi:hypothetical protein